MTDLDHACCDCGNPSARALCRACRPGHVHRWKPERRMSAAFWACRCGRIDDPSCVYPLASFAFRLLELPMKIFALLALFAAPAFAGEALPLPTSDRLLTFEVGLFANGARVSPPSVRVMVREGALFYIEERSLKVRLGFVARIERNGTVSASPSWVSEDAKGWLDLTPAGPSMIVPRLRGAAFLTGEDRLVRLRLVGLSTGSFPDAPPFRGHVDYADREQIEALRRIYGSPASALCCIWRGPFRACGYRVYVAGGGACG